MRALSAAAALLATSWVACAPGPPPDRAHEVGRVTRAFVDPERESWAEEGPRPMVTTIWYPAVASAEESAWRVGGPPGLPAFHAGWSAPDAELDRSASPYPLVLLSHGTGGAAAQLAWLAEYLAAHGIIAAAVNHHGNTAIEDYLLHGFVLWWERAEDLRRVLDRLLADPLFGPHVDRSRIGAAGFSLGGYTVLAVAGAVVSLDDFIEYCGGPELGRCPLPPEAAEFSIADVLALAESDPQMRASIARHDASYRDPRVRAVFAIAPAPAPALTKESLAAIRVPTRIVVGDADTQAPAEEHAIPLAEAISSAELRILPGVAHYTFLAECTPLGRLFRHWLCVDPPGVSRGAVHDEVAADALAFFRAAFRDATDHSNP